MLIVNDLPNRRGRKKVIGTWRFENDSKIEMYRVRSKKACPSLFKISLKVCLDMIPSRLPLINKLLPLIRILFGGVAWDAPSEVVWDACGRGAV